MFTDEKVVEKLIDEVEKRPFLYDKSCKEYSDVNMRKAKWDEATMELVGTGKWNKMSDKDKHDANKEAQKRWTNLRNCFTRELRLKRAMKPRRSTKKRRPYIYYDRLMFLLPYIDQRDTEKNCEDSDDGTDPADTDSIQPNKEKQTFQQTLLSILEKQNDISCDEDRNFALSLVPMLRRLNDYDKLDTKMRILNLFKYKCVRPQSDQKSHFKKQPLVRRKPVKVHDRSQDEPVLTSNVRCYVSRKKKPSLAMSPEQLQETAFININGLYSDVIET